MTGTVGNRNLAICLALAGIALGASACSQSEESPVKKIDPSGRKAGNVCIKVSQPAATRTFIEGADLDRTVWSELDVIGVYWREQGSSSALSGQPFGYYREYADETFFSADVPPVASGDYTYYGAYPVPASVSGTTVTYDLPALQDGTYDKADYDIRDQATHAAYRGNLDFLIAEPVDSGSLTEDGEVALNFIRQCHVLRVQVPTGRNKLGNDIGKLRIEFPSAVVGTMTMDLANPHVAPSLSNGSNVVTLDLRKPVSESAAGETDPYKYVWVFLCPGEVNGTITFTGYNVDGWQSKDVSVTMNKTLTAGHITPIDLTVPEELPVSWVNLSIGGNNLGEDPNTITVKAPDGVKFRNGSNEWTFERNGDNLYRIGFYYECDGVSYGNAINAGGLTVTYDSNNAVISRKESVSLVKDGTIAKSLTVPYLFEEDFSGIAANFAYDQGNASSDIAGRSLADNGLSGWTGARVAGESQRVRCAATRTTPLLGVVRYHGRIDSPLMSCLKPGSSVKVTVNYSHGGTNTNCRLACGYVSNGDTSAFGGGDGLQNTAISAFQPSISNATYTTTLTNASFSITGCTNQYRLSWQIINNQSYVLFGSATTYFVYLDNIKVSIAQ